VRARTARFTQTLDSPSLPSPQVEEGVVYLMHPGRMRWEYARPAGKLAIADGERSWLYLPEDRQVLSAPLEGSGTDQGVSLLLRDRPDLLADFDVSWAAVRDRVGRPVLVLRPRAAGAPYDQLLVETEPGGFPVALTVVDALGSRVVYRLSDLRFADTLDPALFRFTPPPGIAVQEVGR
jgi:outer membrane lipoprotein carrier protein